MFDFTICFAIQISFVIRYANQFDIIKGIDPCLLQLGRGKSCHFSRLFHTKSAFQANKKIFYNTCLRKIQILFQGKNILVVIGTLRHLHYLTPLKNSHRSVLISEDKLSQYDTETKGQVIMTIWLA